MKYLRKIFESNFTEKEVDELKDLCEGSLVYLLDEDFHIRVRHSNKRKERIRIEIYKGELAFPKPFNWNDIDDYFITFYQILSKNYQLQTNWADCTVKFDYRKPAKNIWECESIWVSHEDMLNNVIIDKNYIGVITIFIEKKRNSMKYIRKIFESDFTKEIILEYLESCFVDYIDQGYKFVYYDGTNTGFFSSYTMEINLGEPKGEFNKIAEIGRKITEISENFEDNMRKVNIEYPNFTYYYNIDQNGNQDLIVYIEISIRK